jgi:hypothetical protein
MTTTPVLRDNFMLPRSSHRHFLLGDAVSTFASNRIHLLRTATITTYASRHLLPGRNGTYIPISPSTSILQSSAPSHLLLSLRSHCFAWLFFFFWLLCVYTLQSRAAQLRLLQHSQFLTHALAITACTRRLFRPRCEWIAWTLCELSVIALLFFGGGGELETGTFFRTE